MADGSKEALGLGEFVTPVRRLVQPLWRLGTVLGASDPTVMITGAPRSGTTWLLEMLERATGGRRIWEPFHAAGADPSPRNFGLGWRPYLNPGEEHQELERFLNRLLEGTSVSVGMATGSHRYQRFELGRRLILAPATIVKFCRLQRLVPWFVRRFDTQIVLLVRNPLAVVASQLTHPAWDSSRAGGEHPVVCERLRRDFPELADYALELGSMEEKLAATWAFDYLLPFRAQLGRSVCVVYYEELLNSPKSTLQEIVEHLSLSAGGSSALNPGRPSSTTREDSNVARGGNPRSTWRRRLTDGQVERMLSVIREFGFQLVGLESEGSAQLLLPGSQAPIR